MTARIMVGIVALAGVSVCGLISAFADMDMVDKVNDKFPTEQQFDLLGWYLPKTQRLRGEYRRLYPDGPLLFRGRVCFALMFICLAICAWGLGTAWP